LVALSFGDTGTKFQAIIVPVSP